jgi:UDP-glucuronate decarboxylase
MRILVTGGAGFLGSHLVDRLMANRDEVICLDNLYTGNRQNILKWFDRPNFKFIDRNITELIGWEVNQIYDWAYPASLLHFTIDL